MRVLLTGANGRIGRWVARGLLDSGVAEVCCPNRHAFDILAGSEQWSDMFAKPWDMLIHCAWITSHGDFWSSSENIAWAKASERLFDRFYAAGGERIIGLGTCAEYEWPSASLFLTEASVCKPATLYGQCKLQAYKSLEETARRYQRSFAWSRIFFTFGDGESPKKLIPSMVAAQLAKAQMRCGSKEAKRDFLDFESIGRLIARVSLSQVTGAVNIGSGAPLSLGEIYNDVMDICGGETFVSFSSDIAMNQHFVAADISKLKDGLSSHLEIDVRSKIREYIKYLLLDGFSCHPHK